MKTAVGDRYFSRVCCSRALFDRVAGTCLEVVVVVIVVGIVDGGAADVTVFVAFVVCSGGHSCLRWTELFSAFPLSPDVLVVLA